MNFKSTTAERRASPAERAVKTAVSALVFACALGAATPSLAVDFFLDDASMDKSRTGYIMKNGDVVRNVYMAPVLFTAFYGTGNTPATGAVSGPIDIVGWCVDIYHDIGLGNIDLKYNDSYDLETNSKYTSNTPWVGATSLTVAQIEQVSRLVFFGTDLYNNGLSSTLKLNQLAAVQGAIWQVINAPQGYTVRSSNSNSSIRNSVNDYIGYYASSDYLDYIPGWETRGSNARFISETGKYGTKGAHQSFAFVPEPSSWALMLLGFGGIGVAVRRARPRLLGAVT